MTWPTPPTDAELSFKAPVLLTHPRILRDMILSIPAGDPGAPRVKAAAIASPAAGDVIIGRMTPIAAVIIGSASNGGSGSLAVVNESNGYIFVAHILNAGAIRIKGTVSSSGSAGGQTSSVTIYKNNVAVSSPTGTFSVDVTVAAGDELRITVQGAATTTQIGGNLSVSIANLRICAAEAAQWRS